MEEYYFENTNGSFKISDVKIYDLKYSNNATCFVSISSGMFKGCSDLEIDIADLAQFAIDLKYLHEKLYGRTTFKETFGHSFIEVNADGKGHFKFSGVLIYNYGIHMERNKLEFEFYSDQTEIAGFVNKLYKDFAPYLKSTDK